MFSTRLLAPVALAAALAFASPIAAETLHHSGTISIDETQFGFLIGGNTGGGKLHFKGHTYNFKIGGISIGDIGASKVKASGDVYNLTKVSDFAGTYSKIDASATAVSGKGALRLKNEHGVVLKMLTNTKGLQASAGAGGVQITLK
jgi:hypothetical protein